MQNLKELKDAALEILCLCSIGISLWPITILTLDNIKTIITAIF